MLPSWARQRPREVAVPVLPFWRVSGRPAWSCVQLPDHPLDPAILRAIHEFDPGAIPMVRRMVYLPPGTNDRVVVVHHAIGRCEQTASRRPFYVEMPLVASHPTPTVIDYVHEDLDEQIVKRFGGPPSYRPFDDELLAKLRRMYVDGINLREYDRQVALEADRMMAEAYKRAEEAARKDRRIEKVANKVLSAMTADDIQQWARRRVDARLARDAMRRMQGVSA